MKAQSTKGKADILDSIKIKNVSLLKTLLKDKLETRRKYLQITHPMRDLYTENRKNSQNLTVRKQADLTRGKRTSLSPEVTQLASEYMRRRLTSLVMRERQIKTMVSHHLGFPW